MTRRHLLSSSAALSALSAAPERKLLRPKALRPGDTVGLIAPSSYVSDPDRLALAERTARYFDLVPKFGTNVRKRDSYLGGVAELLPGLCSISGPPSFRPEDLTRHFCARE